MKPKSNPSSEASADADPSAAASEKVVESRDLLGPAEQILIRHEGRLYRLRRTRLGKLILTA